MIKYLRSIKIGKRYYITIESTQQIVIFEYKERASLDTFIFENEKKELKLSRNEVKKILTEYNGNLDGKTCETCRYFSKENVEQNKNKPIANCTRTGLKIYQKNPCFEYEKKA